MYTVNSVSGLGDRDGAARIIEESPSSEGQGAS